MAVAALLSMGYAHAQQPTGQYQFNMERTGAQAAADEETDGDDGISNIFAVRQMASQMTMTLEQPDIPMALPPYGGPLPSKAPQLAEGDSLPTLWANIGYLSGWTSANAKWGYYSFKPTSKTFSPLGLQDRVIARYGAQLKGGHLYGANTEYVDAYNTNVRISDYNTTTWQGTTTVLPNRWDLLALETAQDVNGTVWGEFYTADGSGMEWGTIDYSTLTRTTIGPATHTYVALGITRAGQLYGIATDGNLYKVDKLTGTETLVGSTGFSLMNASNQYYYQTGEIDPRTDTFYWVISTGAQDTGICSVDLSTGKATVLCGVAVQACGMVIPQTEAPEGAPARITDQAMTFSGGSLSGQVTFTLPTKSVAGDSLTGDITYYVRANGSLVTTGDADPGEKIDAAITVPQTGFYDVVFTSSNAAGTSPSASLTRWIGYDSPDTVANVKATADGQQVAVSWEAPARTIHQGVMGTLTYDVTRYSQTDTTTVAQGITATTYTDNITANNLQYYTYAVTPSAEGVAGRPNMSNAVLVGTVVYPDWKCEFSSQAEFNKFTVINANSDGYRWQWHSGILKAYVAGASGKSGDDWLVTPAIRLEGNRIYKIAFRASNEYASGKKTLEVKLGQNPTAAGMTQTLIATYRPSVARNEYVYELPVKTEGIYYVGFHENTASGDPYRLLLDSIVVERGSTLSAPEAVSSLTLTPDANGALNATLAFTAPSKTAGGDNLAALDSITILRNGRQVALLTGIAPGAPVSWTDANTVANGLQYYTVTPYSGGQAGRGARVNAFVGEDIPYNPSNVKLVDRNGRLYGTWDAFSATGPNGGHVNTGHVAISFFNSSSNWLNNYVGDSITTTAKGVNASYLPILTEMNGTGGETQGLYQLKARADGDGGTSGYVNTNAFVLGKSLSMPFRESLKGGRVNNQIVWSEGNAQYYSRSSAGGGRQSPRSAAWRVVSSASSDADGGSLLWAPYRVASTAGRIYYTIVSGDEVAINMPKIALSGSANPHALFQVYAKKGEKARLRVVAAKPDGTEQTVGDIDLSTTTADGWTTHNIDLNALKSERYIILKFVGVSEGSDTYIGLDDINLIDQTSHNLAATDITAPHIITAGKTSTVKVQVKNLSANTTGDFEVLLTAAGTGRDTVAVEKSLEPLEETTVTMNLPMTVTDKAGYTKVSAEIFYDDDMVDADNVADTTVLLRASAYTPVNDLLAKKDGSAVRLTWSKPLQPAPESVTENFDSYGAFATDFGDWTTADGDGGLTGGFFSGNAYPHQGTPQSFLLWNSDSLNAAVLQYNPGLTAHSGGQFAAAPFSYNQDTGYIINQNNWLISPLLSGRSQTVDFYAFNITASNLGGTAIVYPESFEVLYSTTSNDTTSFTHLGDGLANGQTRISRGANWKHFTFDVPEGAKYVAIRHNTEASKASMFGIDDFTYEKGTPGVSDSITAYIVYRDGKRIATVKATDVPSFTDDTAEDHVWNVTVIYTETGGDSNESGFSNDASLAITSGIDGLETESTRLHDVYNTAGRLIKKNATSIDRLPHGVYIIGKKKVVR